MDKKILMLCPSFTAKGGIVNYFKVLDGKFNLPVEYFIRGARNWPNRDGKIQELKRAYLDLQQFNSRLRKRDIGLVQTSTSLGSFSVIRDGLFLRSAQKKGVKTIAFFRGWDENFEKKLTGLKLALFKKYYFACDALIVLSEKFESKLRSWGYNGNIYRETTIVDESMLQNFAPEELEKKVSNAALTTLNVLFLARTEIAKGLHEALDAFILLAQQYANVNLTVAGDGFELENAKLKIAEAGLTDRVRFLGYVGGEEKVNAFKAADVYFFPSYSEGMPNSVLEAMAFGLPVITTPVGGLTDFFKDEEYGFFINENSGSEIYRLTKRLFEEDNTYRIIAHNNSKYARETFVTSKVISRLEKIYKAVINK